MSGAAIERCLVRSGRGREPLPIYRWRRLNNIAFWLANVSIAGWLFVPLPRLWEMPPWPGLIIGFLALDLAQYGIHRLQHAAPFLWRLHAMHHSDPDVDWSTAVRHHPGEYLSTALIYWLALPIAGNPALAVTVHWTAHFILALLTHARGRWPDWLERGMAPIIITLGMHQRHHLLDAAEANANFGDVLSIWDRLFGTLARHPAKTLRFGVPGLDPQDACRPLSMLLTPWRIIT